MSVFSSTQRGARDPAIRSKFAVCLVVLVLLAFTSIRTSQIATAFEHGVSVSSKLMPKQRNLSAAHSFSVQPVVAFIALAPVYYCRLHPREVSDTSATRYFARYFNLPPPLA